MSYVRRDPVGPAITKFMYNKKFRNGILRYWPKKEIDGVEVFDRLYLWIKGSGVQQSDEHKKIYKLMNIKITDLEAEDYTGLDYTYMKVPPIETSFELPRYEIENYISSTSPQIYPDNPDVFNPDPDYEPQAGVSYNPDPYKDNPYWEGLIDPETEEIPDDALPEPQWDKDGWITSYVTYSPGVLIAEGTSSVPTDQEIIDIVHSNSKTVSINGVADANPITFLALKDVNGVLYEKSISVVQRRLVKQEKRTLNLTTNTLSNTSESKYFKNALVKVRFRRIRDVDDTEVSSLIDSLDDYFDTLHEVYTEKSLSAMISAQLLNQSTQVAQMKRMYYDIVGYNNNTINYKGYVRVDAMADLRAKVLGETFSNAIEFDYKETPAKWYEKALVIIIDVIVIIVVVVLVVTGQWWAIPLAFSVGSLVQTGLAMYWMEQGKYAAAGYAGKHAQFLQTAARFSTLIVNPIAFAVSELLNHIARNSEDGAKAVMVIKAVAIAYMIYNGAGADDVKADAGGSSESASEVGKSVKPDKLPLPDLPQLFEMDAGKLMEAIGDNIPELLAGSAAGASISSYMTLLNMSASYYMAYVSPPAETDDLSKLIKAQEEEMAEMPNPEDFDTVEVEMSDPYDNFIDFNSKMNNVPQNMTHGLNANLMNRHFNSGY